MSELTVIIPTWNQKNLLQNCLQSLQRQKAPCHVLVVDNGSTDCTEEMVKINQPAFPSGLEYLNLGYNRGFAEAANAGIRAASTEFVALLNNDTEADERWVETGIGALEKYQDFVIFASKIIDYHHRDQLDSAGDCYNRRGIPYKRGRGERVEKFSKIEPVLGASAAAAFYRQVLFDEIGLFDEDFFMYLEDVDFCLRAQLAGHPCLYLPDAIVYHIEAASDPGRRPIDHRPQTIDHRPGQGSGGTSSAVARSGEYSRNRTYRITRNRWQLMITYQPLCHLPWLVYGWVRSGFFHLFKAGFFGSFLLGLLAGLLATPRALRKRLAIARNRTISMRQFCELLKKY
ncbi:glycosyltransferase family 2 protein [Acidobacteria bacterium AH-259-D05]|nr:glycosyltransferase family 2 protein [Acidobacteria bacterium AH-259-D05]